MTLADTLLHAYAGRCRQDPNSREWTIRVHERGPDDHFWAFCEVTVVLRPDEAMTLSLSFPPLNDEVRRVVEGHHGRVVSHPISSVTLELPAAVDAAAVVRDLAAAIKGVTRRGRTYPEKNWKWIARRTAAALGTFARHLTRHRRTGGRRGARTRPTH